MHSRHVRERAERGTGFAVWTQEGTKAVFQVTHPRTKLAAQSSLSLPCHLASTPSCGPDCDTSRHVSGITGRENMGGNLSKTMHKLFGNKEMRILMLGLDAAGKTSESSFRTPARKRPHT